MTGRDYTLGSVSHFSASFRESADMFREGERDFDAKARARIEEIRRNQPVAEAQRMVAIELLNGIVKELALPPDVRAKTARFSDPDNRAGRKAVYLKALADRVVSLTKGELAISPAAMKAFQEHTGEIDELILFVAKNMSTVPARELRMSEAQRMAAPAPAPMSQALRALRS
ncbi:MAG: hypothetical protein O9327_04930 [Polaromonas sp.]|nr:hypothetical protein [Polaromonas sp.]